MLERGVQGKAGSSALQVIAANYVSHGSTDPLSFSAGEMPHFFSTVGSIVVFTVQGVSTIYPVTPFFAYKNPLSHVAVFL